MDERAFLHEGGIYVSNTRVMIKETIYATANITSVRQTLTQPSSGCAMAIIIGAIFTLLGGIGAGKDGMIIIFIGIVGLLVGIAISRSLKPTYHVMLATAAGERQGFSSQDSALVQRVTAAIADAITFRG